MSKPAGIGRAVKHPDYSQGVTCIVSGGQSAPDIIPYLGEMRVVVVNRAFELVSNAALLYAADRSFWMQYPKALEFPADLKLSADKIQGMGNLEIMKRNGARWSHMVWEPTGTVGYGGNSGFQVLNYVVQCGARRIVLAGYDFAGDHWHPPHAGRNPNVKSLKDWARMLDGEAMTLKVWGVQVLNCSTCSTLKQFEKIAPKDIANYAWSV